MPEQLPAETKCRHYQELQAILDGEDVKKTMANATRWFVTYSHDLPAGPIVQRDDHLHGRNNPLLSERMRAETGYLWTLIHTLYPTSGGSDGYFLTIHMPWEIEDATPSFGYYNQDFMVMQPLSIDELLDMYAPEDHELVLEQILRFLQPGPYPGFEL